MRRSFSGYPEYVPVKAYRYDMFFHLHLPQQTGNHITVQAADFEIAVHEIKYLTGVPYCLPGELSCFLNYIPGEMNEAR